MTRIEADKLPEYDPANSVTHTIYEDEDFYLRCEQTETNHFFVHLDTYNFSPEISNRITDAWSLALDGFNKAGVDYVYALIEKQNVQNIKVAEMYGFNPKLELETPNGMRQFVLLEQETGLWDTEL